MSSDAPAARMPAPKGTVRIARVFGIDVHLHWAWIVVAVVMVQWRAGAYSGFLWNVVEYLALFGIVLLHEFGHALACKSVDGRADHIMLWPLGGVAYVKPPQRPGATLWVSAAGPLVNVLLLPVTFVALGIVGGPEAGTDVAQLVFAITAINVIVLAFNCLPIYPLDGGQMLRSVLWFFMGPHRSLVIAAGIGLLGSGALLLFALSIPDWWIVAIAGFSLMSSWGGFRVARARLRAADLPRRESHACPACGQPPPRGALWPCGACRRIYDPFEDVGTCPHCRHTAASVVCPFCGDAFPAPAFFAYSVSDADEPPLEIPSR